jgi:hypothetical protein
MGLGAVELLAVDQWALRSQRELSKILSRHIENGKEDVRDFGKLMCFIGSGILKQVALVEINPIALNELQCCASLLRILCQPDSQCLHECSKVDT